MPKCFQSSFGNRIAIIIDCFELFIECLTNHLVRAQTFSSYKHHNTIKVLIGITPQGNKNNNTNNIKIMTNFFT